MMSDKGIECATEGLQPSTYQELTPVECVFQNDLLLDKILHFAMMNDGKKGKRKTTNSCMLVQHLWLERVDAALCRSPELKLHVIRFDSKHNKQLEKFVDVFATSPPTLAYRIPPFILVYDDLPILNFPETNYNNLFKCLTKCGSGLVQLEIMVVKQQDSSDLKSLVYPPALTPMDLPKLKSITVRILSRFHSSFEDVTPRIKLFVQSILNGCECLQEFGLVDLGDEHFLSTIFGNFKLPPTLTKINFCGRLASGLLTQLLVEEPLPNLIDVSLSVDTSERIVANELAHILAHFGQQLQKLNIGTPHLLNTINFSKKTIVLPVMERLQMFKCADKIIDWSSPASSSLDYHFPALKRIHLTEITYNMWQKWLQNSTFSLVEEAELSLKLPDLSNDNDHLLLVEQMEQVKQTFPNIVDLSLTIPFTKQNPHIKFIFENMEQLHELKISLVCCPVNMSRSRQEFDAWFLNLNPHVEMSFLAAQRKEWKKITQGNMPDLKKLRIYLTFDKQRNMRWRPPFLVWDFEHFQQVDDEESDK